MRKLFVLALVLGLGGSACGGGGGAPKGGTPAKTPAQEVAPPAGCAESGGGTLRVTAIDNEFEPTCLAVSGDQEIVVKHQGTYTHSFTIGAEEPFRTPFLLDVDPIESGDRVSTGPIGDNVEPGTYPFFCKFHAGMQGEIYVTA